MTVRILSLIYFFVLVGCREPIRQPPPRYMEPSLDAYKAMYEADAKRLGFTLSPPFDLRTMTYESRLSDENDSVLGKCLFLSTMNDAPQDLAAGGKRWLEWSSIKILSPELWEDRSPPEIVMRQLLYHELGHCVQGLDHSVKSENGGYAGPIIMRPTVIPNADWLEENWEALVRELFLGERRYEGSPDEEAKLLASGDGVAGWASGHLLSCSHGEGLGLKANDGRYFGREKSVTNTSDGGNFGE